MKKLFKLDELVFDKELYPRIKIDWFTAYSYARMMKAGAVFPPILVGLYKGKYYVVDGWHRVEAYKRNKEEYIQGTVKKYEDYKTMFLDAIKHNIGHGRQLNIQEKLRLVDKLKEMKFELHQISEIVRMPIEDIKKILPRKIIRPNGTVVYLKKLSAESKVDVSKVDQDSFSGRTVKHLVKQLIEVLKADPELDEDVRELLTVLYGMLEKYVKKIEVV